MGKARILVAWPAKADSDKWRIKEVLAIDEHGMIHLLQVYGVTRDVELKLREKN